MKPTTWLFIKAIKNALVIWVCNINGKPDNNLLEVLPWNRTSWYQWGWWFWNSKGTRWWHLTVRIKVIIISKMGKTSTMRICGSDYRLIVFLEVRYVHVCLVMSNSLGPHGLGASIHGQASWVPLSMGLSRQECWSGLPFPPPRYLPTPGIEPVFPTLQASSLPLGHSGNSSLLLEWVAYPFSRGTSWPRNRTSVSCIAGGFFTKQ